MQRHPRHVVEFQRHVIELQCVALCCTVLHCVALCCTVLRCAALCRGDGAELFATYLTTYTHAQHGYQTANKGDFALVHQLHELLLHPYGEGTPALADKY